MLDLKSSEAVFYSLKPHSLEDVKKNKEEKSGLLCELKDSLVLLTCDPNAGPPILNFSFQVGDFQ